MAEPRFNILSKPPPEDDKKGWYRWFYKVCELLNGLSWPGPFTIGTPPNYTEFEADGTMVSHGDATVWEDINISLVVPTSGAAAPAIINFNGDTGVGALKCIAFSGTNVIPDEVPSGLEVLHAYKEGSDIRVHVHWYPINTTVGNVKWQVRYTWFNRDAVPAAATTVSVVATTSGVAWQEQTSTIVIPGAGKLMGSRFVFNVFRDAADVQDTYAFNAAVTDIGMHYEKDTLGSRQVGIK